HDAPPDRRGRQSPAMVASIKVKPSKQAMCLLRAALPLLRYNGLETIATAWQGALSPPHVCVFAKGVRHSPFQEIGGPFGKCLRLLDVGDVPGAFERHEL